RGSACGSLPNIWSIKRSCAPVRWPWQPSANRARVLPSVTHAHRPRLVGGVSATMRSRLFADDADLHAVLRLVSRITNHAESAGWHHGDVLWGMYANMIFDPCHHIRLWEDAGGALLGFAWLDEQGWLAICIDPRAAGADEIQVAMLAWATERGREQA